MAITLEQQHAMATDGDFINRIRQAMAAIAVEVLTEDPTGQVAGEYQARLSLAQRVINNANDVAKRAAYILVTAEQLNTTDPETFADAAYLGFIRTRWNILAGFNPLYVQEATP